MWNLTKSGVLGNGRCLVGARFRSAQPEPVATHRLVDPEWETALPFERMPSPGFLDFAKNFGPGGKYNGMPLFDIHRAMREMFGSIFRVKGYFGREDTVLSFNPDDYEKVFRTEGNWPQRGGIDTFVYYRKQLRPEQFHGWGGLLTEQGQEWHNMRTIVNPVMMQPKTVKLYITKVDEIALEFMKIITEIRDEKGELPSDFNEWLNRWALETMGVLVLDSRLGVLNMQLPEEASRMIKLIKTILDLFYQLDIMPSIWKVVKTPKFYRLVRAIDELNSIVRLKIDAAIERIEKTPSLNSDTTGILEKLLKVNKQAAIVMSLDSLFAGVDTTSSGTVGALYCLSRNPEQQAKLRNELRTILPNKNSPLTPENMKNLPYLRACIKEALRLYLPTPGNGRATGRDIVLQGYRIPKGVMVGMAQPVLQREAQHFPRPEEFLPERWLHESSSEGCPRAKDAHPFIYLPFGFGARSCVGRRLAMMEMEIVLARIVRQFEVRWNYDDLRFKISLINIPDSELKFQLTEVVD